MSLRGIITVRVYDFQHRQRIYRENQSKITRSAIKLLNVRWECNDITIICRNKYLLRAPEKLILYHVLTDRGRVSLVSRRYSCEHFKDGKKMVVW